MKRKYQLRDELGAEVAVTCRRLLGNLTSNRKDASPGAGCLGSTADEKSGSSVLHTSVFIIKVGKRQTSGKSIRLK